MMNMRTVDQTQIDLNHNLQLRIKELENDKKELLSGLRLDLNKALNVRPASQILDHLEMILNHLRTIEYNQRWLMTFAFNLETQQVRNWQIANVHLGIWESSKLDADGKVVQGGWIGQMPHDIKK